MTILSAAFFRRPTLDVARDLPGKIFMRRLGGELLSVGIADAPPVPESSIIVTTRVGISRSRELPWRFLIAGSPHVSPSRPSA